MHSSLGNAPYICIHIRKHSLLKLSSCVWHQVDATLTQEPSIGNVSANLAEFETLFFSSMINFYYVQRIWKIVGLSRPFWKVLLRIQLVMQYQKVSTLWIKGLANRASKNILWRNTWTFCAIWWYKLDYFLKLKIISYI